MLTDWAAVCDSPLTAGFWFTGDSGCSFCGLNKLYFLIGKVYSVGDYITGKVDL